MDRVLAVGPFHLSTEFKVRYREFKNAVKAYVSDYEQTMKRVFVDKYSPNYIRFMDVFYILGRCVGIVPR